jgi:hypothetical protein
MRYAYNDLGIQPKGTRVAVRWSGSGADVLLLDPVNFSKYRRGRRLVLYGAGGHYRRSPARLTVPQDGHWYAVADLGGYSSNAKATIEVQSPDGEGRREELVQTA